MSWEEYEKFKDSIIAEGRDGMCYESWGYICTKEDDVYKIYHFSHCSCYDTIEGSDELWSGSKSDLINLITNELDPAMPERSMEKCDFDYDLLVELYDELKTYLGVK